MCFALNSSSVGSLTISAAVKSSYRLGPADHRYVWGLGSEFHFGYAGVSGPIESFDGKNNKMSKLHTNKEALSLSTTIGIHNAAFPENKKS